MYLGIVGIYTEVFMVFLSYDSSQKMLLQDGKSLYTKIDSNINLGFSDLIRILKFTQIL